MQLTQVLVLCVSVCLYVGPIPAAAEDDAVADAGAERAAAGKQHRRPGLPALGPGSSGGKKVHTRNRHLPPSSPAWSQKETCALMSRAARMWSDATLGPRVEALDRGQVVLAVEALPTGSPSGCAGDPEPAAKNLSPSQDSCRQAILRYPVFLSVFSSTWENPEVGGGDNLLGSYREHPTRSGKIASMEQLTTQMFALTPKENSFQSWFRCFSP